MKSTDTFGCPHTNTWYFMNFLVLVSTYSCKSQYQPLYVCWYMPSHGNGGFTAPSHGATCQWASPSIMPSTCLRHGGSITDRTKQTLNRVCRAGAYRHDIGCNAFLACLRFPRLSCITKRFQQKEKLSGWKDKQLTLRTKRHHSQDVFPCHCY